MFLVGQYRPPEPTRPIIIQFSINEETGGDEVDNTRAAVLRAMLSNALTIAWEAIQVYPDYTDLNGINASLPRALMVPQATKYYDGTVRQDTFDLYIEAASENALDTILDAFAEIIKPQAVSSNLTTSTTLPLTWSYLYMFNDVIVDIVAAPATVQIGDIIIDEELTNKYQPIFTFTVPDWDITIGSAVLTLVPLTVAEGTMDALDAIEYTGNVEGDNMNDLLSSDAWTPATEVDFESASGADVDLADLCVSGEHSVKIAKDGQLLTTFSATLSKLTVTLTFTNPPYWIGNSEVERYISPTENRAKITFDARWSI
jgi:hypothetical protein